MRRREHGFGSRSTGARRKQIESRDPEQAARDLVLFAGDPGQVRR
jgi:hypothetical protein